MRRSEIMTCRTVKSPTSPSIWGDNAITPSSRRTASDFSRWIATTWTKSNSTGSKSELKSSGSEWKILFFHHPLYSSGEKHGPSLELRKLLEPLLIENGVDVVFAGHEHFYERIKPQHGIQYFILGSSAKLRKDGITPRSELTAKGFDD